MRLSIENKLVLVTGSTSGIGKAIARGFLEEGARVIINGLTHEEIQATVEDLRQQGDVVGVVANVGTAEGAEHLIQETSKIGSLDVLINNVGIFQAKPFEEITDAEWQTYFNVNVMSAVRLSRRILPAMIARNSGKIIIIASEAGVKPHPQMIHYSVTKTALIGLARGMAELTKGTRVAVNSVLPGPTWTDGVQKYFEELATEQGRTVEELTQNFFKIEEPSSLIQRFIRVEEIVEAVLYMSASSAINGSAMRVEGGIIRSIL